MAKKTTIYFGDPLESLIDDLKGTDSVSGRINRAAERYLEIIKRSGIQLTEEERVILGNCLSGSYAEPLMIRHLADEVADSAFSDQPAARTLIDKLRDAPFADLEAIKREIAGIDAAIQALKEKRAGLAKQLPGTGERKPRGESRMARLLRYLEGQTEPRTTDQIAADMGITKVEAASSITDLRIAKHEIENTRGLGYRLIRK